VSILEKSEDKIYTVRLRVSKYSIIQDNIIELVLTHSELLECIGSVNKLLREEFNSEELRKATTKRYREKRKALRGQRVDNAST